MMTLRLLKPLLYAISAELGDVLWYIAVLARELDTGLSLCCSFKSG